MAGARAYAINDLARDEGVLVRPGMHSISVGIAALAVGLALLQTKPPSISIFEKSHPNSFEFRAPLDSKIAGRPGAPVTSSEPEVISEGTLEKQENSSAFTKPSDSFRERFVFDQPAPSFDERFAGVSIPNGTQVKIVRTENFTGDIARSPRAPEEHPVSRPAGRSAPERAPVASSPPMPLRPAESPKTLSASDVDSRTAVYDIAARMVYLPNGQRLEAHSGFGGHLDDPRYISVKNLGPTPPNVYALALRERLFHGVRAIRLIPVGDGKMFGRDGILAHSYMLGPNGQSNGCVSFSNYSAFLTAFLRGDVDRLIVVEHLATTPRRNTASGWTIKDLFKRS